MNFRVIPEAPTMKIAKGELISGMWHLRDIIKICRFK